MNLKFDFSPLSFGTNVPKTGSPVSFPLQPVRTLLGRPVSGLMCHGNSPSLVSFIPQTQTYYVSSSSRELQTECFPRLGLCGSWGRGSRVSSQCEDVPAVPLTGDLKYYPWPSGITWSSVSCLPHKTCTKISRGSS